MEEKPKVIIKYKDKHIESMKNLKAIHKHSQQPDLTDWVYVDRINPTVYPGTLEVKMPDGFRFTIQASEIDIAYGEMAGILFEPDDT